jgi:hypothetical protein
MTDPFRSALDRIILADAERRMPKRIEPDATPAGARGEPYGVVRQAGETAVRIYATEATLNRLREAELAEQDIERIAEGRNCGWTEAVEIFIKGQE